MLHFLLENTNKVTFRRPKRFQFCKFTFLRLKEEHEIWNYLKAFLKYFFIKIICRSSMKDSYHGSITWVFGHINSLSIGSTLFLSLLSALGLLTSSSLLLRHLSPPISKTECKSDTFNVTRFKMKHGAISCWFPLNLHEWPDTSINDL